MLAQCFLNEMADDTAEKGRLPGDVVHFDVTVICPVIQKLRWWSKKAVLIKVKSHAGSVLSQWNSWRHCWERSPLLWLWSPSLTPWSSIGAVVSNVIASCRDPLVAYWMKEMTWTLPVAATYLNTINPIKHPPFCTQCDEGGCLKESLSHFLSASLKFHHARTAAHS